jgi:periplasmic protein TonB
LKNRIALAVAVLAILYMSNESKAQTTKCDSIYTLAQQMPIYGTGQKDFFNYLNKNLEVKKPCKPSDLKRIIFTVTAEGKITDIEVFGVNTKCKDDLVKQLQSFPDWTPGMDQGKAVCVQIILPIQLKGH